MLLCFLPGQAWAGTILANSETGWTSLAKMEAKPEQPVCAEDDSGNSIACGVVRYFWGEKVIITWQRRAGVPKIGSYVLIGDDEETVLAETPITLTPWNLEEEATGILNAIATRRSVRIER